MVLYDTISMLAESLLSQLSHHDHQGPDLKDSIGETAAKVSIVNLNVRLYNELGYEIRTIQLNLDCAPLI